MKFRKILSLLLVLVMMMSAAPLHVQAGTGSTDETAIQEEMAGGNTDVTDPSGSEGDIDVPSEGDDPSGDPSGAGGDIDEAVAGDDPAADESGTEEATDGLPADDDKSVSETDAEEPASQSAGENGDAVMKAGQDEPAYERTIMMYICGSNLETYSAMATYNIVQILNAKFSGEDKIKFIIMTGGSDEWHTSSDLLVDPEHPGQSIEIDPEYNQVWEAKGADAAEDPGKMVLLEKEGLHGEKARDREDEEYVGELMSDPELLKDFIDYCAERYPAEKYDLILWDHGSGPLGGFASDEAKFMAEMWYSEILDAFSDNAVTRDGGKFDFINFDACLMNSVELTLAFADFMDYYIASPENIPGYGQYYTGWLDLLGEEPDYDTYKLGKKIVDDYIDFYSTEEEGRPTQEGTLAVIDMEELLKSGFAETLLNLPLYLKQQATEKDTEVQDFLFYDEFDAGKNSISYGDMNYYDLGTLASQLSFDFKELTPGDVINDNEVIDANIYTEPLANLIWILSNQDIIYARGTDGIRSTPLYHRDIYGKTDYSSVGTSGMYLFFPAADNVGEVLSYFSAITPVITILTERIEREDPDAEDPDGKIRNAKNRLKFLNDYRYALIDYALIAKTGTAVTRMLDEGYERSSIDYDSLRDYLTGGAEYDPSSENLEDPENLDYLISDWNMEFMDYLLIRAGLEDSEGFSGHEAAEAASRDWMNEVITQQAEENISRKDISIREMQEGGFRIRIRNTQKRIVEDVRYNITARIPAAEEFINKIVESGDYLITDEEIENYPIAKIGQISGKAVLEKEDGTQVDQDSTRDYLDWYMEPGGTWELPAVDNTWYTVQDDSGYCHVANVETDEETGELYCYGNYKSENGIDTLCCLSFIDGDLDCILLGAEDGNSYRTIPASELVGTVEVMPIRQVTIFVDDVSIPLSQKPIVVSPETVGKIKMVKKDLNDIDDLKKDGGEPVIERTIVVRDIYGYEIPFAEEETEEFTITYDLNGGTYNGSTDDIVEEYASGTVISIHEAPVREGYKFLYWKGSEYKPGDEYTVTEDHTFTAQWEKTGTPAGEPDEQGGTSDKDPGKTSDNDPGSISGSDTPGGTGSDSAGKTAGVRTGDENQLYIWMMITVSALLLLTVLFFLRRKKEKN